MHQLCSFFLKKKSMTFKLKNETTLEWQRFFSILKTQNSIDLNLKNVEVGNKEIIGAYGSNCPLIFIFSPLFVLLIIAFCYEEEEVQKRITFEREHRRCCRNEHRRHRLLLTQSYLFSWLTKNSNHIKSNAPFLNGGLNYPAFSNLDASNLFIICAPDFFYNNFSLVCF
jgi:hypothetical protein